MFWADKVAQEIKKRNKPLEWVDDMKTPSGKIHVGSLRGVVVHGLVHRALQDVSVNTKFTYVFEDHDPMDALPVYLPKEFENYLGLPLFKVPSPKKGFENFAKYYAFDFQNVFNAIGFHPEIIWTSDLYKSGKLNESIRLCLDNAEVIRTIYEETYKKKLPSDWYPFQVYCQNCGKVSTTRVHKWDNEFVYYRCGEDALKWTKGCGYEGKISPFSSKDQIPGKLPWKVEWPVKWKAIGVTVEGAGKDHMSKGGSHDIAKLVCERVLQYEVPYPIAYEWFLLGGRKMSTSKGVGSAASDMLEILPPELLRFLMVRTRIDQQINFDPNNPSTIPNLFDEYQKAADSYFEKKDPDLSRIFELSQVDEVKKPPKLRFSTLAQWVQMPNMEKVIIEEEAEEWAKYAKIWVERYELENEKFSILKATPREAKRLSEKQKEFLGKISQELDKEWEAEELQKQLYEWAKSLGLTSKEAFSSIYLSLIGKNYGPKAGWLLLSLDKSFVQKRFGEV